MAPLWEFTGRSGWRLRGGGQDYEIISSKQLTALDAPRQLPRELAIWHLGQWLSGARSTLWEMYEALGESRPWTITSLQAAAHDARLKARLTQAFARGELVILRTERPSGQLVASREASLARPAVLPLRAPKSSGPQEPRGSAPGQNAAPSSQAVTVEELPTAGAVEEPLTQDVQATDWIEIELVKEDGEPIPGVRYQLLRDDGSVHAEGALDAAGLVRIENLQPETFQVTFPDLDEQVWGNA